MSGTRFSNFSAPERESYTTLASYTVATKTTLPPDANGGSKAVHISLPLLIFDVQNVLLPLLHSTKFFAFPNPLSNFSQLSKKAQGYM